MSRAMPVTTNASRVLASNTAQNAEAGIKYRTQRRGWHQIPPSTLKLVSNTAFNAEARIKYRPQSSGSHKIPLPTQRLASPA